MLLSLCLVDLDAEKVCALTEVLPVGGGAEMCALPHMDSPASNKG